MEHMLRVHKYISNTSFDNATQKNALAKIFEGISHDVTGITT